MASLPERPSLELLRKRAKALRRERSIPLSAAQHLVAGEYGFESWPRLVRHITSESLEGAARALMLADPDAIRTIDPLEPVDGLVPLLYLLRRSTGTGADVRACAGVLLDAGADPNSHTVENEEWGTWNFYAIRSAVDRSDVELARMLVERGAIRDGDAMYHACERSNIAMLEVLWEPGLEANIAHKVDFEDYEGIKWFVDHGARVDDVLHHAITRGRSVRILEMLIDAGADVNRPWYRWDIGRVPLSLAARCGHLEAYEMLVRRGATAEHDEVDRMVLAVARGESTDLPIATPTLGIPDGSGWLLGQFALLGRVEVVRNLLDGGMDVDTRGWSNFTPLDQAAMHGRADVVRLLVERGADLTDCAFDEHGPTPLDCAIWGLTNNRAHDGDYTATVEVLAAAGAPTRHEPPSTDAAVDEVLKRYGIW